MTWQHVQTFLWLRWRLLANQWRRAGAVNAMLMTIVTVGALVLAIPLFFGSIALGLFIFPKATPLQLLYTCDAVVVAFSFFWSLGLLTELQRTETLSLSKFLHLPVSVKGVFLINYFSSLLRLSLIVFVPIMFGLGLALVFAKGIALLAALPLCLAFLLMVTAITYQFQGWLASLMTNPRRRRTVVVVTAAIFMLVFQLPSLFNVFRPWNAANDLGSAKSLVDELAEVDRAFQAKEFDATEQVRRHQEIRDKYQLVRDQSQQGRLEYWSKKARLANLVLPIGWLPLGIMAAAEGNLLPALLGGLGMTLIGSVSLWRAYGTTVRLYQGQYTARKGTPAPVAAPPAGRSKSGAGFLAMRIPGLSEPATAVALAGLRSLMRAPEARMMLLTSLIMGTVSGSIIVQGASHIPDASSPWIGIGMMGIALFGVLQLMANQFGFDRDGFRVFVLCSAPRRDILLGKNLAFAPVAVGMAAIMLVIVQVIHPLRPDHFCAMIPQFISMYLAFCLLMNLLSIYVPLPIAAGSLKPAQPKLIPVLIQLAMFTCLFPLFQAPLLLPLAIETFCEWRGWTAGVPIALLLALVECAVVVLLYRWVLSWQGDLLQSREQRILDALTNRAT